MSELSQETLSLSSSEEDTNQEATKDTNKDFEKIVPQKSDMTKYFDSVGITNGTEYMHCKSCTDAHQKGDLSRVMKIKNKPENLRKHLKSCKYFCSQNGLEAVAKPQRSKATSMSTRAFAEEGQQTKFHNPPEGCKMMHVKYNRRVETFDVTPGTTGAQIVKDLKTIFGIKDEIKCFLRKEVDKKVLIGAADVIKLIENGDFYKLESM
ncbi:hypothetical protein EIN_369450 [Entamoeba invadens IP1]|uniref:Uncharacterized protein n=1 Tax=Entamoeba invadens IP1 TaxID=370355 RepID=A0A0A1UBT4_ENTIV|nr:hypothetical protein EIN_369450 [Entamoeba invadens IP1]ELP92623.1 hypothetical protein EIN_369450 [Entamoeba invadens IP1]|eukprot:XP_004259394.1 hypothetical protein EIN_369450 [Entamoeba invadens IP1]